MLTKKKQAVGPWVAVVWAMLFLVGCSPSGPDALLDGKRMLDRGQTAGATRKLREAVSLMPTNAMAWGYLGLAYQQDRNPSNAVIAYNQSIARDPNLASIRFNLGSLYMEQGQWSNAREQFAAATVLERRSAESWRWLGESQLRLGEASQAVWSLSESLRLRSDNADAWNWLGVAQLQQGRLQEADRSFRSALRVQANHGPAILNLAILNHQQLKNSSKALEFYRQYLTFLPTASNAAEVKGIADQLEETMRNASKPVEVAHKPVQIPDPEPPSQKGELAANTVVPTLQTPTKVTSVQTPVETRKPAPVETRRAVTVQPKPRPEPAVEKVTVASAPPLSKTAVPLSESKPAAASSNTVQTPQNTPEATPVLPTDETVPPKKRGFFAKINPLNLLKKGEREKKPTPLPERSVSVPSDSESVEVVETGVTLPRSVVKPSVRVSFPDMDRFSRYSYPLKRPLPAGDKGEAERVFAEAESLRRRGRTERALQSYLHATRLDPSLFAGQFNLGLLSLESGDLPHALSAFEAATQLRPDSAPARYNFALALKAANYPVDSANELLTLLAYDPEEPGAHLTLGNLYARQFGDKRTAREHYTRVLELAPGHPQAGSIRFWLVENPQ